MKYNNKNHLKLVEEALNWKKENKNIFLENREAAKELNFYEIQLYNHLFWLKKADFRLLMENYINNSINLEKFETDFSSLWYLTTKELDSMKIDLENLKNFEPSPQSEKFGTYITSIFRQFEELEDEVCNEEEARNFIISILDQIQ